jgi:ribosomal protein S18 acetylase RimI-like enzyme
MVCLPLFFLLVINSSHAFSSSSGFSKKAVQKQKQQQAHPVVRISVTPVSDTNLEDIRALADLRYNEWMANDPNPPSLGAFRAATHEILEERTAEGAVAFLARLDAVDDNSADRPAIGTAELSPIEFQGAIRNSETSAPHYFLYITDVLTSKTNRRMGVGKALMEAMEAHAVQLGATQLFLHVKQDNEAARVFYERPELGYAPYHNLETDDDDDDDARPSVNLDVLAENAFATGQTLLAKMLPVR